MRNKVFTHLTGQVIAEYIKVRLTPQVFGCPRKQRDFAKLNLHVDLIKQPGKYHFFTNHLNL